MKSFPGCFGCGFAEKVKCEKNFTKKRWRSTPLCLVERRFSEDPNCNPLRFVH